MPRVIELVIHTIDGNDHSFPMPPAATREDVIEWCSSWAKNGLGYDIDDRQFVFYPPSSIVKIVGMLGSS